MRERDNRLYELRCSRKLSQGVVGDVLNLSQTRVSAYERGGSIPSEILKAFADFYGVTVDYILRLSDNSLGFRAVHRHNKGQIMDRGQNPQKEEAHKRLNKAANGQQDM